MYYKNYGDTEMKISAVGMGTMRYDAEDVEAGRFEKCAEVTRYAYEKGINYFDTAPFYCMDKSEIITGLALEDYKRDTYFLSSKTNFNAITDLCGYISRDTFRRRLELTLTRLRTDYLDFYHLWCVLNLTAYNEQSEELYRFYEEAKNEGLIKNIVFSAHLQGDDVSAVVNTDKFKGVLVGYNALNYRFRQAGIKSAYEKGMGVVVMNPLGGGLIPNNEKAFEYLKENSDETVAQAALRFVASHREITVALAGCTTKAHVDDACKAVENLNVRSIEEINKAYENKGLTGNSLCTMCGYCDHCPQGIEIPKFMSAYNEKLLGGNEKSIVDSMNNNWDTPLNQSAKCVACGKCEKLCTQHLPIVDRLNEISKLIK